MEDRDGVLEESLEDPMELCFAELVRFVSDSLVEGCFLNVLGLGYHDVTLRSGGRSCPKMTKVSRGSTKELTRHCQGKDHG